MGFVHKLTERGGQSGQSMVSTLIAAAVLGILIVSAGIAVSNLQKARRVVAIAEGARDLDEVLAQQIASALKTFISSKCLNQVPVNQMSIGAIATLDNQNRSALYTKFSTGDADVRRCNTKKINLDGTSVANASGFYLCYVLNINSSQLKSNDRDNIVFNKGAFVQVVANIKNLGSDSLVSCANVSANVGQGIEVYYMTKWLMKMNQDQTVRTRVGSFNVAL